MEEAMVMLPYQQITFSLSWFKDFREFTTTGHEDYGLVRESKDFEGEFVGII